MSVMRKVLFSLLSLSWTGALIAMPTMGPLFFKDKHLNGRWKWSVQLDCTI